MSDHAESGVDVRQRVAAPSTGGAEDGGSQEIVRIVQPRPDGGEAQGFLGVAHLPERRPGYQGDTPE